MTTTKLDNSAERLRAFVEILGMRKKTFELQCGLSNRYLSNVKGRVGREVVDKVKAQFPDLNTDWIIRGQGDMWLSESRGVTQTNVHGPNIANSHIAFGSDSKDADRPWGSEGLRKPILPSEIACQPNVDMFEYMQEYGDTAEHAKAIVLDLPIDMWHIVRDNSLLPEAKQGDMVALSAYPVGEEDPIPGKLHAINTRSNGLLLRKLTPTQEGYCASAPNSEEYPDMNIARENIIRIYRVVFLCRTAL